MRPGRVSGPVARADFKSVGGRSASSVGSTPASSANPPFLTVSACRRTTIIPEFPRLLCLPLGFIYLTSSEKFMNDNFVVSIRGLGPISISITLGFYRPLAYPGPEPIPSALNASAGASAPTIVEKYIITPGNGPTEATIVQET